MPDAQPRRPKPARRQSARDLGVKTSVLVTRPLGSAEETASRLWAMGFEPVVAPLLRIVPRRPTLPDPGAVSAVLVTSRNALPSIPAAFHACPLFAVGDSTAAAARRSGFGHVLSANGDALELAALVRASASGTALLMTASGQGHALAGELRGAGLRVVRRVAYAAKPVTVLPAAARDAIACGRLHAALFLSAATAQTFVRLLPPCLSPSLFNVLAVAIGEPAAALLRPLPWRQVRVSLTPTLHDMLAQL